MLDTSAYYEALREERIMFEEENERLARHIPKAPPPPVSKPLTLLKEEEEVVPHRHNAHDDREEN